MPEPARYEAHYSSTDDAALDAELVRIEDQPQTLDEIKATCRKYGVRARYLDERDAVHELDPSGEATEPSIRRH